MKIQFKECTILEIDDLDNIPVNAGIGISIDYLIINSKIKDEFENHEIRRAIIPMLKIEGKILYY